MPFIPPMLCSRLERLEWLTERRYIAEPKLNGQRAQVHISSGPPPQPIGGGFRRDSSMSRAANSRSRESLSFLAHRISTPLPAC